MASSADTTPSGFGSTAPLLLGVEEEFVLVDDARLPAPGMPAVLGPKHELVVPGAGAVKPELFACMVEVATRPVATVTEAHDALHDLRVALAERAAHVDLDVLASGTHPAADGRDQQVVPTDRYDAIAEQLRELHLLGEQLACGMHVHVAMPTLEQAIEASQQLTALLPVFVGLAANSPWWCGQPTRLATMRSELQRRLPWAATIPRELDAATYLALETPTHEQLLPAGRLRFDITPVARYGTVEVRVMDVQHDPRHTAALVALVQSVCARVLAGERVASRPAAPIEQANRWAALRDGAEARIHVVGHDAPVTIGDYARQLAEQSRDAATELGAEAALDGIERLVQESGAQRQRRLAAAGGGEALLEALLVRAH